MIGASGAAAGGASTGMIAAKLATKYIIATRS
jgi:hypothetical protein